MKNKAMKNLIIFGTIFSSFFFIVNDIFADYCYSYPCNYYDNGRSSSYYYRNYDRYSYGEDDNNYYGPDNYNQNYNKSYRYGPNNQSVQSSTPSVVNNYYYSTTAKTPSSTSTSTTKTSVSNSASTTKTPVVSLSNTKNTDDDSAYLDSNYNYTNSIDRGILGASAAGSITALSLRGSGSFMPSSVWQWIFVLILILIIIIISRMLLSGKTGGSGSHHTAHSH